MRILLLTKDEACGAAGVGVFSARLKKYLEDHGHKIVEIRFSNNKTRETGVYKIPFHYSHSKTMILVPSSKTMKLMQMYLQRLKPDYVYTSIGISTFDYFIPKLCHKNNIPIAACWHGDFRTGSKMYSAINKLPFYALLPYCKQLDMLHVFSKEMKSFYVKKGVKTQNIMVIPNGVDEDIYKPGEGERAGILFLGRITEVKNPEILIKSFLKLNPATNLYFVGTGELESELKEKYKDSRIKFLGLITDEKLKVKIYQTCQIFVLPSVFEGMSLALLEAMASGMACISTNIGTHKEVLKNAGIIIPYSKVKKQLPIKLKVLLENPKLSKELGTKAREKILDNYTQKQVFSKLEQAFITSYQNYHHHLMIHH